MHSYAVCLSKLTKSIGKLTLVILFGVAILSSTPQVALSGDDDTISYLKGLTIEQLLQTTVTSVSKKSEQLFDTASAVFVINQEDLRRTGARNIPEALRMVPGLQVAHIDANRWAISARGFADWFSNKMLVLIDGRSVYTPLFSGVYWDVQDTLIEDIDRIEVIRGPGATVWGANAVNGVINIITKRASETQGALLVAGAGNHEQPLAAARYGGQLGNDAAYRVYAKGFRRDNFDNSDGSEAHDSWQSCRSGFRLDWQTTEKDEVTVEGGIYQGESDLTLNLSGFLSPPYFRSTHEVETYNGSHLLSRWSRAVSNASDIKLQVYIDHTYRDQVVTEERRDTLDLEFQHHWHATDRHDIVWGLGYRWTQDDVNGTFNTTFDTQSRTDDLWSAFVQDDIMLAAEQLWLTLGSKFEHNDYSGFEVQPSLRLRYKPSVNKTLWAAVSRAVRTPSRSDHDLRVNLASFADPFGNVTVMRIVGDKSFKSEELIAYEAGYRWQPTQQVSMDLALFYNRYDHLRSTQAGTPFLETSPTPPHVVMPQTIINGLEGNTYGLEASTTWSPLSYWRLSAGYSWLQIDLHQTGGADSGSVPEEEGTSPEHQFQLRSYLDLPWHLNLDAELYYVDDLSAFEVDGYTRTDLRLGWTPKQNWSFSINVENLLDSEHPEFVGRGGVGVSEVPRIIYGQVTIKF